MKQLIFILAMFACVSLRGQGIVNTSINPLVDTSYHVTSSVQPSFMLPGGNIIIGYGTANNQISTIAKIDLQGDTLKVIHLAQAGYNIIPVSDDLFYYFNTMGIYTAYDTNLNVVSMKFTDPKGFNSSLQYINKELSFLSKKYLNDTFTILHNNLDDYTTEDSFIIIRHELEDTGSNFAIYDYIELKANTGRILIGSCDYLKVKNKAPTMNYYMALIDDSGHTKWKHKVSSASISGYGFPRLLAYTDSSFTFSELVIKDTTFLSQLYICTVDAKGDTIRKDMIKDSSAHYYYYYYTKNETVLFAKDYNNDQMGNYLVIDSNGNMIKSFKRGGYMKRAPSSVFKNASDGWIEIGRFYPDSSYQFGIGYIAHLDSTFCTYTPPIFNVSYIPGYSTVAILNQADNLFLDSMVSFNWVIDHIKGDSIISTSVNFKDTGTHYIGLRIVNKSGCESYIEKSVHLTFPVAAGITNLTKNDYLSVLNNPFNNELTIIYTGNEKTDIKLCDIAGRVVGKMALNGAGLYNMNTTELNQGVYYLYNSVNNQSYMPIKILKVE